MNIYFIIAVIVLIISVLALIFFSSYNKAKNYKDKMDKSESIIDENLSKKMELIIYLNGTVKKVTGKKDYLKDYIEINNLIMTNIEKDLKLDEAVKLLEELLKDFEELSKDEDFNKNILEIKKIDEIIAAAKNMFNHSAILSNQLIKVFPNNIMAKLANFKIRSYYNINKELTEEIF